MDKVAISVTDARGALDLIQDFGREVIAKRAQRAVGAAHKGTRLGRRLLIEGVAWMTDVGLPTSTATFPAQK